MYKYSKRTLKETQVHEQQYAKTIKLGFGISVVEKSYGLPHTHVRDLKFFLKQEYVFLSIVGDYDGEFRTENIVFKSFLTTNQYLAILNYIKEIENVVHVPLPLDLMR